MDFSHPGELLESEIPPLRFFHTASLIHAIARMPTLMSAINDAEYHSEPERQLAVRMRLIQHIGPLGVPEGDGLELLTRLIESALCFIDWPAVSEAIRPRRRDDMTS